MKELMLRLVTGALVLALSGPVFANDVDVVFNGNGVVQNNNSGVDPFNFLTIGKVTAERKDGKLKGKVKATQVLAADPTVIVATIQGKVVCIMELPGSVWELRFFIEKGSGAIEPLIGLYGSLFIYDGGAPEFDGVDESFEESLLADPTCGNLVEGVDFGLEPVLGGDFQVIVKP